MAWGGGRPAKRVAASGLAAFFALLVVSPSDLAAATAGDVPLCRAETAGVVACMAGKACLCRFERAGTLRPGADRYAWDCGVLRPSCLRPTDAAPGPGDGARRIVVVPHLRPKARPQRR